jgi:histidyl-tRNA synthetase
MALARSLRRNNVTCHLEFAAGSLKSQLRHANRLGARNVLIMGDTELAAGKYLLKSMEGSTQHEVTIEELKYCLARQGGEAPGPAHADPAGRPRG